MICILSVYIFTGEYEVSENEGVFSSDIPRRDWDFNLGFVLVLTIEDLADLDT